MLVLATTAGQRATILRAIFGCSVSTPDARYVPVTASASSRLAARIAITAMKKGDGNEGREAKSEEPVTIIRLPHRRSNCLTIYLTDGSNELTSKCSPSPLPPSRVISCLRFLSLFSGFSSPFSFSCFSCVSAHTCAISSKHSSTLES